MTITEGLDAVLTTLVTNERRAARRTGEFLDATQKTLRVMKEVQAPRALPAADAFAAMKDSDLRQLLTVHKVKGRGRKGLKKADRIALCVEHAIPPYTYEFLLNFYQTAMGEK